MSQTNPFFTHLQDWLSGSNRNTFNIQNNASTRWVSMSMYFLSVTRKLHVWPRLRWKWLFVWSVRSSNYHTYIWCWSVWQDNRSMWRYSHLWKIFRAKSRLSLPHDEIWGKQWYKLLSVFISTSFCYRDVSTINEIRYWLFLTTLCAFL